MPFYDLGAFWGGRGQHKLVFLTEGLLNTGVLRSRGLLAAARGSYRQLGPASGSEPGPAARSHRSTRVGGQDDVSSNKLPQISNPWGARMG